MYASTTRLLSEEMRRRFAAGGTEVPGSPPRLNQIPLTPGQKTPAEPWSSSGQIPRTGETEGREIRRG